MQNLSNQILNMGMQMLNMGAQIINLGINIPGNSFEMSNISQQLKDIGNQIQNIGTNIDMKKNFQMNQMMMNQIETVDKWDLIFEMKNGSNRFHIKISPEKKVQDAIDLFRIEATKGIFLMVN